MTTQERRSPLRRYKCRQVLLLPALAWAFLLPSYSSVTAQNLSLFQEMGASLVMAGSGHPELPDQVGVRASSFWTFGGAWLARLSFHRLWDEVEKDGRVCAHYDPHVACRTELTETSSTLTGIQGALMRVVHRGRWDRIAVGGGVSFNQLNAESVGESGQRADLLSPNTGQVGFLGQMSVALLPYPPVPFVVAGGVSLHWVGFHTCSGETPRQYDPFCQGELFREVEVGLSYLF